MPYPAQVSRDAILGKAREMIEAEGVEALALAKLAAALAIKAPSLYRYFESKAALLRAVNSDTATRLVEAMRAAVSDEKPLLKMAIAYRQFAHEHPAAYALAFGNPSDEIRPDEQELERLALPLQAVMAQISGEAHSLAALRGSWALLHGFVSLELAGHFRRAGDVEQAFVQAVEAYARGWRS
jgi:AcrR family transcriptional regulator